MDDLKWLENSNHTPEELRRIAWQSYKHDRKAFLAILKAAERLSEALATLTPKTILCSFLDCSSPALYHRLDMGSNWCEEHLPPEWKGEEKTIFSAVGFHAVFSAR